MPRNYPGFIIDRSRRSPAARFSDDFIVCTDRECGFIARAYILPKSRLDTHITALQNAKTIFITKTFSNATTVVVEIVEYLHPPMASSNRVPQLLTKALKTNLYGEVDAVRSERGSYAEQIAAIDDVLRLAVSQKERMIDAQGEAGTERFINALKATRETVILMQKIKNQE